MSEIDFSGLKKKKKKAVVESFESLTLDEQKDGSEKEETIDFSELKKKKKKKVEVLQQEESVEPVASEEGDERDYTYHELLSRVFGMIKQHNPELVGEKKKFTIPPPQVAREGTKKTLFANIVEICKRLHRLPDHLIQYLFAELGTTGSIDGAQRLLIKGRFQQKQIEIVLKRYIAEYVQCKTCRSPDTNLVKENRLFFLQCESCGSSRTVSAIKTGFMAQTGKRSAMRNGYKDLFEADEFRSEYRKPTRKDFLRSSKKNSIPYTSNNGFENPLKEAISNRKVPKTNLYYIRKPHKVPPSYLASLKNLDDAGVALDRMTELMENNKKWDHDHQFSLKFNQEVEAERSPVSNFKNHIWKEPAEVIQKIRKTNQEYISKKVNDAVDHGLHKSSWLRDVSRPSVNVESNDLILQGNKLGLKFLKEDDQSVLKKETYSTRNVEFMLDIWQKSEGVNLDDCLKSEEKFQLEKKLHAYERSKQLANERAMLLSNNSLYVQAKHTNSGIYANPEEVDKIKIKKPKDCAIDGNFLQLTSLNEELKSITEREVGVKSFAQNPIHEESRATNDKSDGLSPRSIYTPQNGSYLSKSTIRVLKKLSLEENEETVPSLPVDNPNEIVKITLTGPQEVNMQPYFLSDGNRSFVPIRVKRRLLQTTYSPGAWSKLIQSSFLPNGEIRISETFDNEMEPEANQFQLVLHNINALDEEGGTYLEGRKFKGESIMEDDDDIDSILSEHPEESQILPQQEEAVYHTPIQRRLSKFQRKLSIFNQKNAQTEKKIYTLEELNEITRARKEKERADSGKKYFSLTTLCGLIKRFLKYFEDNSGEPFGLPDLPPGAPLMSKLQDFISSKYCELECLPETDMVARISLLRALSLSLRETQQKELCYEAAQILLTSGMNAELGRWDALLLKDVLSQMLIDGSHYQKDLACIAFCEANQVNEDIIQHLRTGLGDIDDKRRQQLNFYFSNLDLNFAPIAMEILIKEASNINYRVRIDVIHQISNYIEKLSCSLDRPIVVKHTKYSSHEEITSRESVEESEIDSMVFSGIELLLRAMWEDWSDQVRDLASVALGRLQQGNAIYNHLIHLIKSEFPAKRLDALKCLGYMGLLTKTSLPEFIACFSDPYTAIRLQACKVACKLKSNNRILIEALLDSLSDSNWQIRAFSIKAVGLSGSQSPKIRTSLHWCMMHDEIPAVRVESVVAFKSLGFVDNNLDVKEWLITLLQTDPSEEVKKEAEKALVEAGIILPATNSSDDAGGDKINSLLGRIPPDLALPFPNVLEGKTAEEIETFLRESLIEDKEHLDVINQVRLLAKKDKVLQQVQHEERHSGILPKLHLDLNFDKDHIPNLKAIHCGRKKPKAYPTF